jgi:cbb3-type cytochrome oxidase cytochrome c subunit/predicted  nucleic acid-binding Zn-ribbon protein
MADRGDTHYRVGSLNLWFAVSSLFLLGAAFWMVIDDWNRPWKAYQREFQALEVARARAQLEAPEAQAVQAEEERLRGELERARQAFAGKQGELTAAEAKLRDLKGEAFKATEAEKKVKQVNNWERFLTEEERLHLGDETLKAQEIKEIEDELYARAGTKQAADAAVAAQERHIAELKRDLTQAENSLKNSGKSLELVRKKLDTLAPADVPTQIANVLRDFPGLDFVGPTLKVQKTLPPSLTFELNFTQKPRIDMCQTCHVPIDREGFEDGAHPFRSHPRLDLFLTAKSPHPQSDFGCTICHRGNGEALDFQRIDHRPSDEAEAARWAEERHWHKQHYWDYPMLPAKYIEASCVQCHKSSMDLIADEAPKVAEGFQLFERYGCYACHKVDWFPTKRRPGPSLARLGQKTTQEFIESWIAEPKGFRPTTWMPQIFHLENYSADVTVVHSEYGKGREMKGDEWSDAAVASVSAFVRARAASEPLASIPVTGDARRGREVFRLVGCLACHNTAPYTAEARAEEADLASRLRGTNEHGPNLRGVATKVTPEWLYAWIKDPAAYWSETRMPDLRLSDQDAADIVAYVFEDPLFRDVPADWKAEKVAYRRDVLEEQARWFFNRELRTEIDRRFAAEWKDDQALLEALGEKWVLGQGCHSCHSIPGLEDAQPIGTELTTWASKTVDKLDFGFMHEILGAEKGWSHHEVAEFKEYRENFLEQKLRAPRSFDRKKIKNPSERLKMPWFDFTEPEIEAITCFVAGLVNDEVQRAKMVPTGEELAMDTGKRVVRQKNCAGCHQLEPGRIEFLDEDGVERDVHGEFLVFDEDVLPPPMAGFAEYVEKYEADVAELEEVIVRLLAPQPGLGNVGDTVVIENLDSLRVTPPHGGELVDLVTDYYFYPDDHHEDVEDVDGERRNYAEEAYDKVRWTFAPPVLWDEGGKVQRDWFYEFLLSPARLREQVRVRMPTFAWGEGEAGAVADYFASRSNREWPARYARRLLLQQEMTPAELEQDMARLVAEKQLSKRATAAVIQGIVDGQPVETATGLEALLSYGHVQGFSIGERVNPRHEAVGERLPGLLDALLGADPAFFDKVHLLATDTSGKGPNCVQCHFLRGASPTQSSPVAWAPDLDHSRERLRPEWVREWLTDPSRVYPGTSMPANFSADPPQWQELLPAAGAQQIESVLTWLFNLDRAVRN